MDCGQDISQMEAGPEMDALVYQRVFGGHEFFPHEVNNALCKHCHGGGLLVLQRFF